MAVFWSPDDDRAFYRHAFYALHGWVECITSARREDVTTPTAPVAPPVRVEGDGRPAVAPVRPLSRRVRWVFWSVVTVVVLYGLRTILA